MDGPRRVVALVTDLMDRSRLGTAVPGIEFARDPAACSGAAVVVVDLTRSPDVGVVRAAAPRARIVAYGPHVDEATLDLARRTGADLVLPRSRFFNDPAAALAGG